MTGTHSLLIRGGIFIFPYGIYRNRQTQRGHQSIMHQLFHTNLSLLLGSGRPSSSIIAVQLCRQLFMGNHGEAPPTYMGVSNGYTVQLSYYLKASTCDSTWGASLAVNCPWVFLGGSTHSYRSA